MLIVSEEVDTHGDNDDTLAKRNSPEPPINEEGDAPCLPINQVDDTIDAIAVQSTTSKRLERNPYSTYKHFARNANRTLTTFTNEMSELLRQSIERLDSISMKVRGCVYEIEKQRVGMIGILGDGCSNVQQSAQTVSKLCTRPYQNSSRILGEIEENVAIGNTENSWASEKSKDESLKEFAVKCRKQAFIVPIERKLSNVSEQCEANSECQFTEVLQDEKTSKPNSPKQDERHSITNAMCSDRATPDQSRSISLKKQPTLPMSFATDANEKEVMNKIVKQHRQLRAGIENESSQLEQTRDKYEIRPKRKMRVKKEPTNATIKPSKKRVQSKLVNDAYVKENYNDNLWFGPQLNSASRKSIKSTRNSTDAGITSKVAQNKNTKLSRKFASFNFHDPSQKHGPAKVESYTGGKLVYLANDSPQDWSVYMHTQKSPTRYDLKQNAQFPTNNILDEITLKDLEPLKAEYPRRDHILESNVSVEDSLLYKLVNGEASSLECLISVCANAKSKPCPEVPAVPANTPPQKKYVKRNISPQKAAALQISPNSHIKPAVQPHSPQPQHVQTTRQKTSPKTKHLKQVQVDPNELSRGDDKPNMRRAGINRSTERKRQTTTGKKNNPDPKKIVAAESKRIAQRLSDIKSNVKYTLSSTKSDSMQDYQIYRQMSKKDARKRLKKYVNNPTKTHQKYMVMMVNEMCYDNYSLNKDGLYQEKSRSVAEILAPYIYYNDASIILKQELTIAMMTTTYTSTQQNAKPRKLDSAKVANIKRGVDMSFVNTQKHMVHINDKPSYTRDGKARIASRSTAIDHYAQASGMFPGKVDEPSAWKQAIRSCFNANQEYPSSTNGKSLNPNQMNAIITSMELQLKQVMENPKIENKSTVIKGLQEEMEWILSNIEGHTNALNQRRGLNNYDLRKDISIKHKFSEKRVPLPKNAESKTQRPSTVCPKSYTVLKKTSGNILIPRSREPPKSEAQEMQTKLMSKWQWLEHPSAESMGSETMKRNEDLNALKMLIRTQPKRSYSKPETRCENLMTPISSFGHQNKVQMVTSEPDSKDVNDQSEDISESNQTNEDILMPVDEVECKGSDISIYTSCDDLYKICTDKSLPKNSNSDNSHLTEEEIMTYRNNIKRLERQLSEETERFVEEIHEVMSKVQLSTETSKKSDILDPLMNAVKEYKDSEENKIDSLGSNICDVLKLHKLTRVEQATQIACRTSTKSAVTYICSMLDSALVLGAGSEKKPSADKETDVCPLPTPHSISLTLNHNLRRTIVNPQKSYTVDARSFKSLDSPMMQGIKRDLFGSATVNYPLSRISLMRKPQKTAIGTSVSLTNVIKKESSEKHKKVSVGVSRSETLTALTANTCQTDFDKNIRETTEPPNRLEHTMKQRIRKLRKTPRILNEKAGQDQSEAHRTYRNFLSFCYTVIFVVVFFGLNLHYVCGA